LAKGMSELLCRSIASKPPEAFAPDIGKMQVE
jgi:TetR/AcrR family transcriptional regulator